MKFDHIGIPTTDRFDGEIDLPHLNVTVSDHQSNPVWDPMAEILGRRAIS